MTQYPCNAEGSLGLVSPYGDSQVTHPKLIDVGAAGLNGYRYWMSYTPYPYGDSSKENPCVAASNDLIEWVTPEGLNQPLDVPEDNRGYNSDSHLVFDSDSNTLEL